MKIRHLLASHEWIEWTRFEETTSIFLMEGCSWPILAIYILKFCFKKFKGILQIWVKPWFSNVENMQNTLNLKDETNASIVLEISPQRKQGSSWNLMGWFSEDPCTKEHVWVVNTRAHILFKGWVHFCTDLHERCWSGFLI